jgi:hypothetical protein
MRASHGNVNASFNIGAQRAKLHRDRAKLPTKLTLWSQINSKASCSLALGNHGYGTFRADET